MKYTSVFDALPKPNRYKQYLCQTEEGYVVLQSYNPRQAEIGDPLAWWDEHTDCGAIIAWCDPGVIKDPEFSVHHSRFQEAQEKAWEEEG